MTYTALLDANVLCPAIMRDIQFRLHGRSKGPNLS